MAALRETACHEEPVNTPFFPTQYLRDVIEKITFFFSKSFWYVYCIVQYCMLYVLTFITAIIFTNTADFTHIHTHTHTRFSQLCLGNKNGCRNLKYSNHAYVQYSSEICFSLFNKIAHKNAQIIKCYNSIGYIAFITWYL